jgi:CRP-like cAMP-binding protein
VALTGLSYRHKIASNGLRQIIGLVMPGEAMDFQQLMLDRYDHSIQAATNIETLELNRADLTNLAFDRPNIGKAIWTDALVASSIYQEWLVNVGRRNAKSRVAHFFCEYVSRVDGVITPEGGRYLLSMTQEQIGDATSLTSVHVNRMIKALVGDKVIEHERPFIIVTDHRRLCQIAGFDPAYLHFDQSSPN